MTHIPNPYYLFVIKLLRYDNQSAQMQQPM